MITERTAVYWTVECDTCGTRHRPVPGECRVAGYHECQEAALQDALRDGWDFKPDWQGREVVTCMGCIVKKSVHTKKYRDI